MSIQTDINQFFTEGFYRRMETLELLFENVTPDVVRVAQYIVSDLRCEFIALGPANEWLKNYGVVVVVRPPEGLCFELTPAANVNPDLDLRCDKCPCGKPVYGHQIFDGRHQVRYCFDCEQALYRHYDEEGARQL